MSFPIEIIAVSFLSLIWFVWMLWYKLSLKKNKRRYDPENDLSRKGEEERRKNNSEGDGATSGADEVRDVSDARLVEPKGSSSVPKRTTTPNKKNSRSISSRNTLLLELKILKMVFSPCGEIDTMSRKPWND